MRKLCTNYVHHQQIVAAVRTDVGMRAADVLFVRTGQPTRRSRHPERKLADVLLADRADRADYRRSTCRQGHRRDACEKVWGRG